MNSVEHYKRPAEVAQQVSLHPDDYVEEGFIVPHEPTGDFCTKVENIIIEKEVLHPNGMIEVFRLFVETKCKAYDCPFCGPTKVAKWKEHLTYKLMEAKGPVYILQGDDVPPEGTLSQRLTGEHPGSQYVFISSSDGPVVITTSPYKPKRSDELPIEVVTAFLDGLEILKEPDRYSFRTSRSWKLPKDKPPAKAKEGLEGDVISRSTFKCAFPVMNVLKAAYDQADIAYSHWHNEETEADVLKVGATPGACKIMDDIIARNETV